MSLLKPQKDINEIKKLQKKEKWIIFFENKELLWIPFKVLELIKQQTKKIVELEKKALFDPLTWLFNRNWIEEKLKKIFNQEKKWTIITVDIKDLREINNKYGYLWWDEAIKNTAEILKESFRWEETWRNRDIISRYWWDEFLIITDEINENQLINRINKLKEKIKEINEKTKYFFNLHICYTNDFKIKDYKEANDENHKKLKEQKYNGPCY